MKTVGISQTGENVLATFPPPIKGMMQNTETEVGLPPEALWVGRNVHLFRGELRQRASWTGRIGLSNSVLNDPPRGSAIILGLTIPETLSAVYTARRAGTPDRFLFTGGNTRVQILQDATSGLGAGSGWKVVTNWNGASALEDVGAFVRFTEIAIGSPLLTNVIMCNGLRAPRVFKLGSTTDLATPTFISAALGPSGGVWPAVGNRFWVITALNGVGETLQSNEVSFNVTDTTKKVTLTWQSVPGAVAYNIYRSTVTGVYTSPALARVVNGRAAVTDDDPGLATTAGAPPGSSTALGFSAATTLDGADPWLDVCVASDRVVGITKSEASWGETLRVDTWPALNHKSFAETTDYCRAIRPLMGLHVMVWKEKSLWIGQARGGSSASYFTWKLQAYVDGPVSPRALVQTGTGVWYWMTRRGRIVRMSPGFQIDYPCDGVWPFIRTSLALDETSFSLAHGVYDPLLDEVRFFYTPSLSDLDPITGSGGTGNPDDIYGIPTVGTGIIDGRGFGTGNGPGLIQLTETCCGGLNDGSSIYVSDEFASPVKRIYSTYSPNASGGNSGNPASQSISSAALSIILNFPVSSVHGDNWRAVKAT